MIEPKTEREFMILFIDKVERLSDDIIELKKAVVSKSDIEMVKEIAEEIKNLQESAKVFQEYIDRERQKLIDARDNLKKDVLLADLKSKKARRTQIIIGIVSGLILTAVLIYINLT